jgi:LysM domain
MSTFAIHPGFSRTPARPARRPRSSSVRLTRRGRLVAVVLLVGLVLALLTVFGPHSAATGETGAPVQTRTVEVGPGDNLWGIASQVAEPGHVREMVHQIEELNALSGPAVAVGQEVAVPVG